MHFPLSSCKNLPPYFLMVHLLHRLYGVDAPDRFSNTNYYNYYSRSSGLFSRTAWVSRYQKGVLSQSGFKCGNR